MDTLRKISSWMRETIEFTFIIVSWGSLQSEAQSELSAWVDPIEIFSQGVSPFQLDIILTTTHHHPYHHHNHEAVTKTLFS